MNAEYFHRVKSDGAGPEGGGEIKPGDLFLGKKEAVEEWHRRNPSPDGEPVGVKSDGVGPEGGLAKPRWDLLPFAALGQVVDVLTYGAAKYSADNWRRVPQARDRYFAATLRHATAWWNGERHDPETGLPHLAHAVCSLLFLLELEREGEGRNETRATWPTSRIKEA